jgi:hypothetical protein
MAIESFDITDENGVRVAGRIAFAALLFFVAHISVARADPASCLFRFSAYVRELDPILAEAKYSITPIIDLNERYFPFVDCDPGPLVEVASRSRFFRQSFYDSGGDEYYVEFSSDDIGVTFTYRVSERVSFSPSAGFLRK